MWRVFGELSFKDIGEIYGKTDNWACVTYHRARKRYATPSEHSASYVNYSLELWSAHLGDAEGYIWVYYSMEAIDSNGDTVHASSHCEALWKVEKNENGVWEVVSIREHP